MAEDGRVVTTKLSNDLALSIDEVARRIDRTKSWIVREALRQWLTEEQCRHKLSID